MNKLCSLCKLLKPIAEFQSGRSCCRPCRTRRDAARRKAVSSQTEKTEIVELAPTTNTELIPVLVQAQKLDALLHTSASQLEKVNAAVEIVQEIYTILIAIQNGEIRLGFQLQISQPMQKYLTQIFAKNEGFVEAKAYLAEDIGDFEDNYDVEHPCISKVDIENIERATSFVRTMYHTIADEHMVREFKFSSGIPTRLIMPTVTFNPSTSSIVLSKNPLKITQAQFLAEIQEFDNSKNIVFVTFKEHGIYDAFKKIFVPSPVEL